MCVDGKGDTAFKTQSSSISILLTLNLNTLFGNADTTERDYQALPITKERQWLV